MRALGMNSNIMSLGGIAISIGVMVDAAIVMIENAHKHIERSDGSRSRAQLIIDACREVGPALFFSLMIITVSFLPVFALEAQEGRLFKPLAFTKTFAMAGGALLSVTLVPVLMLLFVRGRIVAEQKNPVNRFLVAVYRPVIDVVLRYRMATIAIALVALFASLWPASRLGSEFMPTLNEGTLLYMPTSLPGMSVTKASELLQQQDRIIKGFPEVESVFGKAGRALTATDPAPLEMFETVINLRPEDEWRNGMTTDRLIAEMDEALKFPGVANSWTMPIKARTDMLATGIRTPVGIKLFGNDLEQLDALATEIEAVVREVPGTTSAFAERLTGAYYLDITPDLGPLAQSGVTLGEVQDVVAAALGGEIVSHILHRRHRFTAIFLTPSTLRVHPPPTTPDLGRRAQYGVTLGEVQDVVAAALGGEIVTTSLQGRERFSAIVRYPRELRDDPHRIGTQVLVAVPGGAQVPLGELARIEVTMGAPSIRIENAMLAAYIYVDTRESDLGR